MTHGADRRLRAQYGSHSRVGITALVLLLATACQHSPASSENSIQTLEALETDPVRLEALYQERTRESQQDYPIGPGDQIELTVPAMPEIQRLKLRVSSNGSISLPLLGRLQAGGKTENELHNRIHEGLAEFMHKPEFSLLVTQQRNRQVGVLGAVVQPGLHSLNGPGDTILDLLSQAGGLTERATRRLRFLPSSTPRDSAPPQTTPDVAAAGDAGAHFTRPSIIIDLDRLDRPEQQLALSIPLRPGDTLIALGGGKVFLRGWVNKPGVIPMSRGLTVLGAITEAGGFAFPAKPSAVRILREAPGSDARQVLKLDVAKVEAGTGQDLRIREGDIVEVDGTAGKLVLYGSYRFVTSLINVGLSLSPL